MIKGCLVKLHTKKKIGEDEFHAPIYEETIEEVENVLIEPVSDDAVINELQLSGKRISYMLHIPNGDTHNWNDSIVELPAPWNESVKTFGGGIIYDPKLTPLDWFKKVKAEKYG